MKRSKAKQEKVLVHILTVKAGDKYRPFEIKLPLQVESIRGIIVTNTVIDDGISRIGTLCLQSNDESDVFMHTDLEQNWQPFNDQTPFNGVFGGPTDAAWVTGKMPLPLHMKADGKTGNISGWYKPIYNLGDHTLRIYVEYKAMEELT